MDSGPRCLGFSVACDALLWPPQATGPVQFPGLCHAGSALRIVRVHRDSGVHTHFSTLRKALPARWGPAQGRRLDRRLGLTLVGTSHPHPACCSSTVLGNCSLCFSSLGCDQQETDCAAGSTLTRWSWNATLCLEISCIRQSPVRSPPTSHRQQRVCGTRTGFLSHAQPHIHKSRRGETSARPVS